jgi:hypothetical protein
LSSVERSSGGESVAEPGNQSGGRFVGGGLLEQPRHHPVDFGVCAKVGGGEGRQEPPEVRNQPLKLHTVAMAVINE